MVIGEEEKVDFSKFSDSKLPFPKDITGKKVLLIKDIERFIPAAQNLIKEFRENYKENLEQN